MEYLPVGLFAVAAVGGLTLVTMKLTGKGMRFPWPSVTGSSRRRGWSP